MTRLSTAARDPRAKFGKRFELQAQCLAKYLGELNPDCKRRLIHDTRVLTRRLRATLSAVENAPFAKRDSREAIQNFKKALKKFGKRLGPVRALDVMEKQVRELLEAKPPAEQDVLEFCASEFGRQKKRARRALAKKNRPLVKRLASAKPIAWFADIDWPKFLIALERNSGEESRDALINWRDFEKSGKLANLHQTRIHLKKWKYLMEIQNLFRAAKSQLPVESLKHLQDQLGSVHDRQVLLEMLASKEMKAAAPSKNNRDAWKQWRQSLEQELDHTLRKLRDGDALEDISRAMMRSA